MPHTLCFGQTRKVDRQATVSVGDAIYSVPHELIGERVWVRAEGDQLVVVHIDPDQGPREVARHRLTTPGRPSIQDAHYPPRPAGALERKPRARNARSATSLRSARAPSGGSSTPPRRERSGSGARWPRRSTWPSSMAPGPVNDALARCASYGRFADGDLASILAHQQTATVIPLPRRAPAEDVLAAGLDPQTGRDSER